MYMVRFLPIHTKWNSHNTIKYPQYNVTLMYMVRFLPIHTKWNSHNTIKYPQYKVTLMYMVRFLPIFFYSESLRAVRSGDRITVGVRFSAPVPSGPGLHPASCAKGTGSLSRG